MANEEASSPGIPADDTGSDSHNESTGEIHPAKFSEATAGIGHSDELLKNSFEELSKDAVFLTAEGFLGVCSICQYPIRPDSPLRPGSQQHTEYCVNPLVQNPRNETFLSDNGQEHLLELPDPSLFTTAGDLSTLTTSTAIPADASEDVAGESHHTDEPDIDPPSIQPPHLPHDTDIQPQPAMEFERHISNDGIPLDEPSLKRHIQEAHTKGSHPCPHPKCKKSKDPFKRSDKLRNHLKTCNYALASV
ncbi:hypothetical protein TRIATDRAFT_84789 [Trichoderma atroviride IMI 206040]|uniref:Uncharacterized protein n=1 Tax=Hypocrea atroviridis (strain ATCC 20476 / IMI 206040) TaxID=452589 RepID=G9P671_HYPAI|nr:uncharacterized protein TRIATDRAFT_84789 [Trichoderma atroviride IMI 206040]EHK41403.1 hypothetical protein TRIATDRAFT_84789 [Trichoderma atroviride IMI 206040]